MGRSIRERIARRLDPISYYVFDCAVADATRIVQEIRAEHASSRQQDHVTISQLKFLLISAPMIDAPRDAFLLQHSTASFGYIHPKTLARLMPLGLNPVSACKTRWISTTLMPEERIIYSPRALPGTEKRMAG